MKKTKFEKAQLLESKTLGYGRDLLEAVLEELLQPARTTSAVAAAIAIKILFFII